MRRPLSVALTATTAVVAVGLSGCSHSEPKVPASATTSAVPAASSPVIIAAPPTAPVPVPDALIDVLNRLADPNIPGINKVGLVEGATPESAATLDKFINALRDNGYLPMTFAADNIAWSDKNPSDVTATIRISTAHNNRTFTFPMEFTPYQGGWQLSRRTAEMLLALGNSPAPPTPPPGPPPIPGPSPAPKAPPAPAPSPAPPEPTQPPVTAPSPASTPPPAPPPAPPPESPPPSAPPPESPPPPEPTQPPPG